MIIKWSIHSSQYIDLDDTLTLQPAITSSSRPAAASHMRFTARSLRHKWFVPCRQPSQATRSPQPLLAHSLRPLAASHTLQPHLACGSCLVVNYHMCLALCGQHPAHSSCFEVGCCTQLVPCSCISYVVCALQPTVSYAVRVPQQHFAHALFLAASVSHTT